MEMDTLITCLTDGLEKLIEKKKEYDDVLKSLEDPRPDFFGFFQHFSQTWILDSPSLIKVLTKLRLHQSKFHQNFDQTLILESKFSPNWDWSNQSFVQTWIDPIKVSSKL